MTETFKIHLKKFIKITDDEYAEVLRFFEVRKLEKKENLLAHGQICSANIFVLSGCLRKFFIKESGIEQTTEFAIETWWITDNIAYERGLTSEFFIQAVEKSHVLTINRETQERLLVAFPKMERYFRFVYQRAYAASQMRIKFLYDFSKEEIYEHMRKTHPQFVQRIPQYLLASFLGFTPEYLSEIRKRRS
ncbi:CRP-like cAMP-binding protein [Pedobacter sp. UYP30]|uniref:Crp/Fnr family transcriptional regulator n=1 Tax=Pedobacter sp. UYP30 TaxID=1756400 RepID=UPI003398C61F